MTGEDADPVTVTVTDKDGITTDFKVTVTEAPTDLTLLILTL